MDTGGTDNFQQEKRNEDLRSYHPTNLSSDWRFGESNPTNSSMGSIPTGNPMAVCKGDPMESSSCSSAPSFCPTVWDHPTNTQSLGFCDINLQNSASTSNTLGFRKGPLSIERALDMCWVPPNSMVKGGLFLPAGPGMLPQSLSQFPSDTGFIERAARFSSFGGENFGDTMNPFSIPESMNPYARGAPVMQRPQEVFAGNRLKSVSGGQSQKNEVSMAGASKDVSISVELGATEGSPLKNERKSGSFLRSHDEAKQGVGVSSNESDEAEFSGGGGGGGEEEPSSSKAVGLKKRKRSNQGDNEPTKDNTEIQQKGDQTPTLTTNKPSGKHGKQGSQASGSPKEEYIHVRARRGQATNSHSLAERVRREKISERMKLLQDIVPGCSKVTGKAVMLDEIINYVQSLQRQVEFLSMKLATVNPRLDFSLEGLLAKDILQSRAGPSCTLGYSPDMTMPFPSIHPSQPGLTQTGLPGMSNSLDALRISINSQLTAMSGGYKEPTQVSNLWGEDELHNVVQMGFNSSVPLDSQDLNGTTP